MSDRLFGTLTIVVALAYIASATQIKMAFFSDPLGPRWFPYIIGGVAVLAGLSVALRPDEEPEWPNLLVTAKIFFAGAVLVAYALTLKPLGFLIPTALAAGILSFQIEPRRLQAVLTGLGLSIGLFLIFKYALGLGLFAVPKGWIS